MKVLAIITSLMLSRLDGAIVVATCDKPEHFGCHVFLDETVNLWSCSRGGQIHFVEKPIYHWSFITTLVDKFGFIPAEVWEPPSVGERLLNRKREEMLKLSPAEQNALLVQRSREIDYAWTRCILRITTERNVAIGCTLVDFQKVSPNNEKEGVRRHVSEGQTPIWNALMPEIIPEEIQLSTLETVQDIHISRQSRSEDEDRDEFLDLPPDDSHL